MGTTDDHLPDVVAAHKHCTANEGTVRAVDSCGCFYCLRVFPAADVAEWVPSWTDGGRVKLDDRTAVCPRCGIDSVLPGTRPEFLERDFLEAMHRHWF